MFPFNISSYIHDLITFDQLSDKNQVQFMQEQIILFHVSLKNGQKTVFQAFLMKILDINLSFLSVPFLIFELNCSKTNSRKLKVKFYSYR